MKMRTTLFLPLTAVLSVLLVADGARGQVVTETNFNTLNFNTNAGYVRGVGIISTSQPSGIRWQGNDTYNAISGLGETDLVARASGYTPAPLANSSLLQGGLGVGDGILPGTNNVQIWKSFNASTTAFAAPTVSLFAEWSIIGSTPLNAPYTNSDAFSFDLRNAANTTSLLNLKFTPGINILSNAYTLQTIAAGSPTDTVADLVYGGLFQIQVDMTGSAYSLSLARINPTTRAVITNFSNLASGSLSAGTTALDFATLSVGWELTSGDNLDPGSNYLLANQFQVTTSGNVIPEPGTWVASLVLLGIGAGYYRRRRSQRLAA